MKTLLKNGRESKGLKTREVAGLLKIDQALISKFESGTRNPTHSQLIQLSSLYDLNINELEVLWLKNRILETVSDHKFALDALKAAEQELSGEITTQIPDATTASIEKLMADMESLKSILSGKK